MAVRVVPGIQVAEPRRAPRDLAPERIREERDMRKVELFVAAVAILASVVLALPK